MKRMNIPLMAIISILIMSCNPHPKNQVEFGYLECLTLDSSESQVNPIDSLSLNEYEKYCFYNGSELWLNRVLKGENTTYIGMSTRMAPKEYIDLMQKDSLSNILLKREYSNEEKLYYSFFLKRYDKYIFRTIYSEPKQGNLILYDITNSDSSKIQALYNDPQYMINKLHCD